MFRALTKDEKEVFGWLVFDTLNIPYIVKSLQYCGMTFLEKYQTTMPSQMDMWKA